MNKVRDYEIDASDAFQTLWGGRWIIIACVAIFALAGGAQSLLSQAQYVSRLIYSIDTIPPFIDNAKVPADFRRKFYSASVFNDWIKDTGDTSIVLEDLSGTEVVEGFEFSKNVGEQVTSLFEDKRGAYIRVQSNQYSIFDDVYRYANYVNEQLKKEYLIRASEELSLIETRFKELSSLDGHIIEMILAIDRYIVSADRGKSVLVIQRPTIPKRVSLERWKRFVLFGVSGGVIGVLFTFLINGKTKRKEQLAES